MNANFIYLCFKKRKHLWCLYVFAAICEYPIQINNNMNPKLFLALVVGMHKMGINIIFVSIMISPLYILPLYFFFFCQQDQYNPYQVVSCCSTLQNLSHSPIYSSIHSHISSIINMFLLIETLQSYRLYPLFMLLAYSFSLAWR